MEPRDDERDEHERDGVLVRLSRARKHVVDRARRRPRLTIAASLLAFGAITLAGRTVVRVARGRKKAKASRPTERAPELPIGAAPTDATE